MSRLTCKGKDLFSAEYFKVHVNARTEHGHSHLLFVKIKRKKITETDKENIFFLLLLFGLSLPFTFDIVTCHHGNKITASDSMIGRKV